MKKLRLLLLDANVVIVLCQLGLWDIVLETCEVLLARTVFEEEAQFYENQDGEKVYLDLSDDEQAGRLQVIDVAASVVAAFDAKFKSTFVGEIDPGEKESLTYIVNSNDKCLMCSGDKIVFRVLGALNLQDQGISLEEVLRAIGRSAKLSREFSKAYREEWTEKGQQEAFLGQALRQ